MSLSFCFSYISLDEAIRGVRRFVPRAFADLIQRIHYDSEIYVKKTKDSSRRVQVLLRAKMHID